jgi:hypothetical protein
MKKLLQLVIVGAILGSAFLACQSNVSDPTPIELLEEDDNPVLWEYPAIYGYCKDDEGNPIYMASVTWTSPQGEVGYCVSRIDGWYRIADLTGAWVVHDGEDLDGEAYHALYDSAYAYIQDFEYTATYRRDFEMNPNPGHEQPIETNGKFDNAYVRNSVTGDGIYPATVSVVTWNGFTIALDTT